MIQFKHLFRPVNVAEERVYEKDIVARKRDRYLQTNPLDRMAGDLHYRQKIDRMRRGLHIDGKAICGLVLDIGGNTAGEATILRQEGFQFVVGDINEVALDISRTRVVKFGLKPPSYVALDVYALPFESNSFSAVTVIEALHHFPDYGKAMAEIHRVLKPGGIFYSYEPNALSPLRRLSEVRDRLRGTVEKSFYQGQVRRLCRNAGFAKVFVRAVPGGKSTWKMEEVPCYRRPVARLHGYLSEHYPLIFGPLEITARKVGDLDDTPATTGSWLAVLRSPRNRLRLEFDPVQKVWSEIGGQCAYPDLNGIPVLIDADAIRRSK